MAGLWERFIALVESLDDHDWLRPVPWTPLWTVADLVAHVGGGQSQLNGTPQPPAAAWSVPDDTQPYDVAMAPAVAARRDWTPRQRIDELASAARDQIEALANVTDWDAPTDSPAGPTTQDGLFKVRAFDVWVHLQDLRDALGADVEAADPSPGAAAAAQWVLRYLPWMFVKRAGAAEGATMRVTVDDPVGFDDVLEVRNGRAGWNSHADPEDCLVRATPAALTLLTCGRGSPQRWRDAGALTWEGPRGDEFAERGRLF